MTSPTPTGSQGVVKTVFDLSVSLMLIILVSPLLVFLIVLIKLDSPGPVLFRQTRIGLYEKPFEILKIRTMTVDKHRGEEQTLSHSTGITRVGRLLRRFKLDELPQLFNVLRGQMSIVGPRPCLLSTLTIMDTKARQRFSVKPGLTGLAQVNGNVCIEWADRWRYDVHYVEQHSFLLDLKIIFKTVLVVLFGEERYKRLFDDANTTDRVS